MDINEQVRKLVAALEIWLKAEDVATQITKRYTRSVYANGFFDKRTDKLWLRKEDAKRFAASASEMYERLEAEMPRHLIYQFPDGRKFYDLSVAYAHARETGQTAEIHNARTGVLLMALSVSPVKQPEIVR